MWPVAVGREEVARMLEEDCPVGGIVPLVAGATWPVGGVIPPVAGPTWPVGGVVPLVAGATVED